MFALKLFCFAFQRRREKTILSTLSFGMCIFAANLRASVVASILLRCLLWVAIISDSCPAGILFLSIAPICSLLGGIEYWTRHLRYFPFCRRVVARRTLSPAFLAADWLNNLVSCHASGDLVCGANMGKKIYTSRVLFLAYF